MVIDMNEDRLVTLPQLRQFVEGTTEVEFRRCGKDEDRYRHIEGVLRRFRYARLKRADKGLVVRYLMRTTGYSRPQLVRLIKRARAGALKKGYRAPTHGFARRFTDADVALLAATDTLHGTLSGPATRHLMQRALAIYGDARYARLATISNGHLYNLRQRTGYIERRREWTKTHATQVSIGERRAPAPDGRPGFIRIDSVHQGDQDGVKGVYHINAVDCLTQWELVATCEKISEAYLLPVIASPARRLSLSDPRLPCRQWLRVHQPQSGQAARQAAGGIHQIAAAPLQRQRLGRNQERGRDPQAAGLRTHPAMLRHGGQCLLRRAPQPVPQFPSALPVRRGDHRQEGQDPQALPPTLGHDPVRKTGDPRRRCSSSCAAGSPSNPYAAKRPACPTTTRPPG